MSSVVRPDGPKNFTAFSLHCFYDKLECWWGLPEVLLYLSKEEINQKLPAGKKIADKVFEQIKPDTGEWCENDDIELKNSRFLGLDVTVACAPYDYEHVPLEDLQNSFTFEQILQKVNSFEAETAEVEGEEKYESKQLPEPIQRVKFIGQSIAELFADITSESMYERAMEELNDVIHEQQSKQLKRRRDEFEMTKTALKNEHLKKVKALEQQIVLAKQNHEAEIAAAAKKFKMM